MPVLAWPMMSWPAEGDREGHRLDGEGADDAVRRRARRRCRGGRRSRRTSVRRDGRGTASASGVTVAAGSSAARRGCVVRASLVGGVGHARPGSLRSAGARGGASGPIGGSWVRPDRWLLIGPTGLPDVGELRAAHHCRGTMAEHQLPARGRQHRCGHCRFQGRRPRRLRAHGARPRDRRRPAYHAAVADLLGARVRRADRLHAGSRRTPTWPRRCRYKSALAGLAVAEFGHYAVLDERLRSHGRRPGGGDGAVRRRRRRLPRAHPAHRLARGAGQGLRRRRASPRTSTARSRRYVDAGHPDAGRSVARGRRPGRLRRQGRARGHRRRPAARRAAGAVGPPPRGRGPLAGAARRRSSATRSRRCSSGRHDRPGADLAELGRMFARLTDEHSRRMERLGLSA